MLKFKYDNIFKSREGLSIDMCNISLFLMKEQNYHSNLKLLAFWQGIKQLHRKKKKRLGEIREG